MKERKLFSVGDLCIDVLQGLKQKPVFGEEHSLGSLTFSIGGNAANFSVLASKQGLDTTLISAIGKDFSTSFLKKELAQNKVHTRLIESKKANAYSIIQVTKDGERAIQSVKNCLEEMTTQKVERIILPAIKENDIVFFGGFYHLKNLRKGFISLLNKIKTKKVIVCFDTCFDTTGKWNINPFLKYIDFLFVNELELEHIAKGKNNLQRTNLLFKKGATRIIVKQGAKGASYFEKDKKMLHSPSVAKKIVDSTGAGDAFNAGFVKGLTKEKSPKECLNLGNESAAKKIAKHGI